MEFVVGEPGKHKVVEIVGPFVRGDYYYLSVNGCKVPHVRLFKNTSTDEWESQFEWELMLDDRFVWFANQEEIERWGDILANGMAVAAGFTYCGPNSRPSNKYATQLIGLDSLPDE